MSNTAVLLQGIASELGAAGFHQASECVAHDKLAQKLSELSGLTLSDREQALVQAAQELLRTADCSLVQSQAHMERAFAYVMRMQAEMGCVPLLPRPVLLLVQGGHSDDSNVVQMPTRDA